MPRTLRGRRSSWLWATLGFISLRVSGWWGAGALPEAAGIVGVQASAANIY